MIAVGHIAAYPGRRGPGQGVPKAQLGPEAAVLPVIDVPGYNDKVGPGPDGHIYNLVEGLEGGVPEASAHLGIHNPKPLKGAV
jgi:hypothetical protein